jgi:hypothetical protein
VRLAIPQMQDAEYSTSAHELQHPADSGQAAALRSSRMTLTFMDRSS